MNYFSFICNTNTYTKHLRLKVAFNEHFIIHLFSVHIKIQKHSWLLSSIFDFTSTCMGTLLGVSTLSLHVPCKFFCVLQTSVKRVSVGESSSPSAWRHWTTCAWAKWRCGTTNCGGPSPSSTRPCSTNCSPWRSLRRTLRAFHQPEAPL